MGNFLLGIDVGTTNTKSVLITENGDLIAASSCSYEISAPEVSMQEQDAEELWNAVVTTVRDVAAQVRKEEIKAISLSVQGGTLIVTDEAFRPIAPAIVWSDTRAEKEAADFAKAFGTPYLYETTGWQLENSLVAMQILWLRRNRREIFDQAAYFLSVPDFIAARLTGVPVLDPADAGINQLYDIRKGAYDPAILSFLGIGEEKLGKVLPTGEAVGTLLKETAEVLGLSENTVFINGVHDQYAVAVGAGCTGSGDVLIGTGTAWVVAAMSPEWDFAHGFSESHSAVPGVKGSILSLSSGGVSLEWLRKNILKTETVRSYDELNRIAEESGPGAGGVFFYPYFTGAYGSNGNREIKAAFLGLDLSHRDGDLVRAVMEGVVYEIARMLEAIRSEFPIRSIRMTGGATKSPIWPQILADVTGIPVAVPGIADLAPVGAAIIAGVGSRAFSNYETGFQKLHYPTELLLPDKARQQKYREFYIRYREGAAALRTIGADREEE